MNLIKITFIIIISFYINLKVYAEPVHKNDYDVSEQVGIPTGVIFNPSGTKMYVTGFNGNSGRVAQYSLSVPYSTSSGVSLDANIITEIAAVLKRPQDIKFNSDGSKVLVLSTKSVDADQDSVAIWSLGTPYDITTISSTRDSEDSLKIDNDPRGFDFNTDGTKMFILKATTDQIEQYDLTTPYDTSDITLKATLSNLKGDSYHQGFGFSSDGYKMFVIKADRNTDDTELNIIEEYDLTTPFEIATASKNEKTYNTQTASEGNMRIAGITFNFSQGANKFYHLDFDDNKLVREYDLPCAYGIITCIDPTNDKDDVASIEVQSEATKKLIQHNTYPVLNRMEWLRRNSERVNLTNQNIKFQFNNAMLNSLSDTFIPLYFSNDSNNKSNYQNSSWSFWSEGTISIGNTGNTNQSSSKSIDTSAITLGADKKGKDNIMRGIALRFGADDVDVGDLGSALDMSSFSLTFYESKPKGEQRFTDHLIGISFINSDLINNSGSVSTDGDRYGEQLYGSLSLRDTFSKDQLNFTPKLKINYGITHLGAFTETGAAGLNLNYDDQYIGNFTSALGTSLDNTYDFKNGSFIPYFDFEYYADMSPSSKQKFSYASNGESFTLENINNSTHNFKSGIGFDFISENGLNLMTKYTRDQAQNNKNDSFIIALDYRVSQRSSYAMSIEDTSTKLSHNKELNGLKINLDSYYDFFKDGQDYGVFLEISNIN